MFMSQPVCGKIVNYRTGIRTQMPKYCLIQFATPGSVYKADQLIGRKVVLKYGKSNFVGKITGFHGKNGVVKAKFRRGVPGQALGTTVELIS